MGKKVNFDQNDIVPEVQVNQEMFEAMENAKKELKGELDLSVKTKGNNVPTKRKSSKSLSAKDIITQKEDVNPDPLNLSPKHDVMNDMKVQINELLPTMNIDLNNIIISDSLNSLEKHSNLDLIFNSTPTFQVPLPQSCYVAYMNALKFDDIDAITNSTMDEYHSTLKIYQIIHNRIQATSIGPINFDTFCECTSFFDLQSLFYGLHMQTFPGSTKFDFKCVHCEHEFSHDIPNDSLVFSKDEAIFERLNEIAMTADNSDAVIKASLLSEHKRVCLEQSKTIIDIRVPSLKNQLDILKSTPTDQLESLASDLATLLFIKNVYLLNVPETLEKKSPVYYPVSGNEKIIKILKQLSINDSKQLARAIDEWTNKYKTEYRIPNFKCPSCGKDLGEMPVDMENVLFRLMLNQ